MNLREVGKRILDGAADIIKNAEEQADGGAVVLEKFSRSLQLDDYSCGAQCAFAILQYFGKARSINNVTRQARTDLEGTDATSLRELFLKRGLRPARINSPTVTKLRREIDLGNPVLVSLDEDHWAVVYGYGSGCIFVTDPSMKRSPLCRHSTARFRKRWDRWAMAVRP